MTRPEYRYAVQPKTDSPIVTTTHQKATATTGIARAHVVYKF